ASWGPLCGVCSRNGEEHGVTTRLSPPCSVPGSFRVARRYLDAGATWRRKSKNSRFPAGNSNWIDVYKRTGVSSSEKSHGRLFLVGRTKGDRRKKKRWFELRHHPPEARTREDGQASSDREPIFP